MLQSGVCMCNMLCSISRSMDQVLT